MRLPSADREAVDRLKNHFISKMIPGVGTWGELDALRGWKDDFLGKALHEQYLPASAGAGASVALQDGIHGGVARFTLGAVIWSYAALWLGDNADGFDTLDADNGWVQIARFRLNSVAGNFWAYFGAMDSASNNIIMAGDYNTANWAIRARDGGGASVTTQSAIAIDTSWHWHALDVFPANGGRTANYWLDGNLILTVTANVPQPAITPLFHAGVAAAVARSADLDYWAVIPRNLA